MMVRDGMSAGGQEVRGQAGLGLALAAGIVLSWLVLHVYAVFFHRWSIVGTAVAPLLVAAICWLNVGLFIVAHDAMHGSLAPGRPALNRAVGRVCLALYAGFSYDRLIGRHFDHHRFAGTADDPDFHAAGPRRFWPWYVGFVRRYFGAREFAILTVLLAAYVTLLGAEPANVLGFWAVPALLSSVQLFYFGTFLPHRHDDRPFADHHRARSSELGTVLSLLTCFHFGYHHEHHAHPHAPWWRLPRMRAAAQAGRR